MLFRSVSQSRYWPELDDDGAAMEKYIESYVDYIKELFDAAKKEDASAIMLTEQRVDYGEYARDSWGTSDVIIIANKHMTVIDLKYGKGVPVDAPNNPQLLVFHSSTCDKTSWCLCLFQLQSQPWHSHL